MGQYLYNIKIDPDEEAKAIEDFLVRPTGAPPLFVQCNSACS